MSFRRWMWAVAAMGMGSASADVKPAAIFGDHMVLQAGASVPIWGKADPGEEITVELAGQSRKTKAGPDGKWMVRFGELAAGGPHELTFTGQNRRVIKDVLVGEVWLGSGQSNMDFVVSKNLAKYPEKAQRFAGVENEEAEIAAANHPRIRMFTVATRLSEGPVEDVAGKWEVCSPDTVPGFSAVGYYFARDLEKELQTPVGFIKTAFGASCAQAWVARADLEANPRLAPLLTAYAKAKDDYQAAMAAPPPPPPGDGKRKPARPPRDPATDQHNPALLWNGMLQPLQPYAIKGVLWYQGESITEGIDLYPLVVETLITSWRKQWGQGDFPFYFVQLAAYDKSNSLPDVRAAQAKALGLPNTAMAVTIDIGDKTDVHPHNKRDVGARLARIALARDYGKPMVWSGPVFDSVSREGNRLRVKFGQVGGGLVAKDGPPKWFELAGADGKFHPAAAEIDGNSVVLTSGAVPQPKSLRYAWHRYPEGVNFGNADGLPAVPFRTTVPD